MTIYNDVEKYAKTTMMTVEDAKMRCEYYLTLQKEKAEAMAQNIICPQCKQSTLELEYDQYEEGNEEYVEAQCKNEECEYYCEDHPHAELIDSFDVVLMYAGQVEQEGLVQIEEQLGSTWAEFVAHDNADLLNEIAKKKEDVKA